jgi:hypothetical protein
VNVNWKQAVYPFQPWKPEYGRVFTRAFAFDCETTRIDEQRRWLAPAYVLGAVFDGADGYFLTRDRVGAFFRDHTGSEVVFHHAPFDLKVVHALDPDLDVYRWVDEHRVWDTLLLHKLYVLGRDGHTDEGKGKSTLERLAAVYLGVDLPKDPTDSLGNTVRLSYARWLNRPPHEIEPVYLTYLAGDAIATYHLYHRLRGLLDGLLAAAGGVWGHAGVAWLREQVRRWGPQTHHIQLQAAVALAEVTASGLHIDAGRRDELVVGLRAVVEELRAVLREEYHFVPGRGADRALQAILARLARQHPKIVFPRTPTGKYAAGRDDLQELADVPFVRTYLEYRATEKLLSLVADRLGPRVIRPDFRVLTRTGRTSSFGEINAQNLPRDDRVRSCIVPSDGRVFVDVDFKTIELVTLAQACLAQFRLPSAMAAAINAGEDLHRLVAARVTGKPPAAVTKRERSHAKPINFGKPGGMGLRGLQRYARASYGVVLTTEQVKELSDAWFREFPEMREFLADEREKGWLGVAVLLGLTPTDHAEATGDRRFVRHPDAARQAGEPTKFFGAMCLKVLRQADPTKVKSGEPYPSSDVAYFWSRAAAVGARLPKWAAAAVGRREPSPRLALVVLGLADREGVFTLTGRLRASAGYCQRHNTVFQGLASDGAKLALWKLWRAGYRVVNFVHDQCLVEVPAGADLTAEAESIRKLMIGGMVEVVPDVRVDVSYAATDRWYKEAEATYDPAGRLVLWRPEPEPGPSTPAPTAAAPPRPADEGLVPGACAVGGPSTAG